MSFPLSGTASADRLETDLRYGAFILRQTDLLVNDAMVVPFTRIYNSLDWLHPNPVHAFGRKTNHPYDIAPLGSRNLYTFQLIALEDSDLLYFPRISSGTSYRNAVFQHTETASAFYKATTRWNGNGWTTELANGSRIVFPESYSARNMAQGAPLEMLDSSGHTLVLRRDGQRNLVGILAPNGGFIKLAYDDKSRIVRSEDNLGHWVRYRYGDRGLLMDVEFSSGASRHYSYDEEHMTWIKDERGRALLHNYYDDDGRVRRQDFADGSSIDYQYKMAPAGGYAQSVVVTLPNGVRETVDPSSSVSQYLKNPPAR